MDATTDLLLVRCRVPSADGLPKAAQRFAGDALLPLDVQRVSWSPESHWAYLYFAPRGGALRLDRAAVARLAALWKSLCDGTEADVSRLELLQDLAGRSHGEQPTRHYVVETDPEAAWEEEITRWYIEEHLPGLASVAGCVDARRFRNHDAGPRSHACYSLVTEDTLGCPPWLVVRGSDWSSRVRPHFNNTRRPMLRIVG